MRRWRGYLFFPPWTGEPGGFYIGLCERRGCSGALCQRCPVSLSPPLCLDAFETGREGMWPVESASSGMNGFTFWVVFKVQGCFHPSVSWTPGRLKAAERQHCSVAEWINYRGIPSCCFWGIRAETHADKHSGKCWRCTFLTCLKPLCWIWIFRLNLMMWLHNCSWSVGKCWRKRPDVSWKMKFKVFLPSSHTATIPLLHKIRTQYWRNVYYGTFCRIQIWQTSHQNKC